jgi:ribosome-binding protein aMBF1 (putative translation factor)
MCLTPDCKETKLKARGLCERCYFRLVRKVQRGTVSWQEYEAKGLAEKTVRKGPSAAERQEAKLRRKETLDNEESIMEDYEAQLVHRILERGWAVSPNKPLTNEERKQYESCLPKAKRH